MDLEDLQQAGGPSDGSGGPPTALEDPKSGPMGQEVLQHPSNNPSVSLSPPIQSAKHQSYRL